MFSSHRLRCFQTRIFQSNYYFWGNENDNWTLKTSPFYIDKVYLIVHVRCMLLKEFNSVILFYDSYFDRIRQFFSKWLKRFKIVNKCDAGNTCFVYVRTPVPIAWPLFISLWLTCIFYVDSRDILSTLDNWLLSGIYTANQFIEHDFIYQIDCLVVSEFLNTSNFNNVHLI